jgi:hypothetical protein
MLIDEKSMPILSGTYIIFLKTLHMNGVRVLNRMFHGNRLAAAAAVAGAPVTPAVTTPTFGAQASLMSSRLQTSTGPGNEG